MRALRGVLAAVPTPVTPDLEPDIASVGLVLSHAAAAGCHGALVLGTTGEGPSCSVAQRRAVLDAAADWRAEQAADFLLLGGTGAASLGDAAELTASALGAGFDGAVVLPPFYYRAARVPGLLDWYSALIDRAVPGAGRVFVYHIPQVSGVAVPAELLAALARRYPAVVAGAKDSGGDLEHTRAYLDAGESLAIFTGYDPHLWAVLDSGGAGSITALANVAGPLIRSTYDAWAPGTEAAPSAQAVAACRAALDAYPSVAAVKALLAAVHGLPRWPVLPPLEDLPPSEVEALRGALQGLRTRA